MNENLSRPVTVLVIARQGRLRDGLQAILQASPWVDEVVCQQPQTAVPFFPLLENPTLIVLDIDVLQTFPQSERHGWRAAAGDPRLIVLVNTAQQRHQALELVADAILLKGFSTETLYRTLEAVLRSRPSASQLSLELYGR
ncbi:MAG: response regulator transcription factor [Ardenticatenaceae bacterium]|nr:response regulator transcription factor [Ardenticatenaceae bacterium]MCB8987067.1 response regulator transcription factor [Ardenticatenaceae bacterium]